MLASQHHPFPGDLLVSRAVQDIDNVWWARTMTFVTSLAQGLLAIASWAAAIAVLLWCRSILAAVFIAVTPSAYALTFVAKLLVNRPRPEPLPAGAAILTDPGFPSAHVLYATVFYGFLFYLVWAHLRPSIPRSALLLVVGLPVVLMGASRVYLGVHWPSDAIGGYLLGVLQLIAMIYAYKKCARRFPD